MTSVTTAGKGTVVISSGSTTVTYTPNTGFNGTAGFDYALSDGTGTDRSTRTGQKPSI